MLWVSARSLVPTRALIGTDDATNAANQYFEELEAKKAAKKKEKEEFGGNERGNKERQCHGSSIPPP